MLFPGTGDAADVGGGRAAGCAVNVAFPPGTGDAGWLRAFHAVVPPLLRAFAPDVLVTQHGCDSHVLDPLAHMALSLDAQRASYAALHDLAHEFAHGRWVALGGGGYEVVDVVPRAWAHLVAIAAHRPVDPAAEVPDGWRLYVQERVGRPGPGEVHGRTRRDLHTLVPRARPGGPRRPRRHGHPPRGVPVARPRPLVRLTAPPRDHALLGSARSAVHDREGCARAFARARVKAFHSRPTSP